MMWRVPSVALGTLQPAARCEPIHWGMLGALAQAGLSVQAFASSAVPDPRTALHRITGRPLRHLDSWLQDEAQTLAAWQRGGEDCQAATLHGSFCPGSECGGASDLETLCQRVGLPRVAIVDVTRLDGCRIPVPPGPLAGIFLDRVGDCRSRIGWQTLLEALWDAPVLGWLEESLPARRMAELLAPEQTPSGDLLRQLAEALSATLRCDKLCRAAQRASWLPPSSWQEPRAEYRMPVRVAVAFDEAFPCYSADMLQILESAGACVNDFSPLRCERLPEETDLVLIGTGTSDRYWPDLARNCCMQQALRSFAARGGRVYAEGSGLAYISRQIVQASGDRVPGAGLIPAEVHHRPQQPKHVPARLTTAIPSWLFGSRQELCGYRDSAWHVVRTGPAATHPAVRDASIDLLVRGNVIGSRIVVPFASRPTLLRRFLTPFAPLPLAAGSAH